jgi:hypothetical protein
LLVIKIPDVVKLTNPVDDVSDLAGLEIDKREREQVFEKLAPSLASILLAV